MWEFKAAESPVLGLDPTMQAGFTSLQNPLRRAKERLEVMLHENAEA
jgi:hypothetical protein